MKLDYEGKAGTGIQANRPLNPTMLAAKRQEQLQNYIYMLELFGII
jgi:hypothetical protein